MGEFKRSSSKVWWASESVEWREISESPGSQDSGFSDTETSPHLRIRNSNKEVQENVTKNILKQSPSEEKPQNLSINYKEKETPDKCIKSKLDTQSPRQFKYTKASPKVSRNIFNSNRRNKEFVKDVDDNQYSKDITSTPETTHSSISSEDSYSSTNSFDVLKACKSFPFIKELRHSYFLNKSAPEPLENIKDEEEISFNGNHSLSSDCESELECLFKGSLDSPKHTSTPKSRSTNMRYKKSRIPENLFLKYQQERVSPLDYLASDNPSVQTWMKEIIVHYEQECMTTLQSKSIAGELNQQVSYMAIRLTNNIRNMLSHSHLIETEYKNLNGEKKHVGPLAQSLAGNIVDFLKKHLGMVNAKISKQYDEIRKTNSENALQLVSDLFNTWQPLYQDMLLKESKKVIEKLENPHSELDLRAAVTGITFLCLNNEELIDIFTKNDVIPILLILCEKCEGSSMRGLLLRALATLCCNSSAMRQFEKFSGVQIISDTLEEDSRPEPERSEAAALLAQVTAPWIEDNHCIKGLKEYLRRLVKSLTKFASTTQCCQNLLLCAAALANLSTMDSKCIKYMLHLNTIDILLRTINNRATCTSVYLLEQIATLFANISVEEAARKQLTKLKAVTVLLCFLKRSGVEEDAERRLQQKSIIALSRLCSEREAAMQVVELGGVERLVKMCRERNERFDSDAVLVATLATLRKISSVCGSEVIKDEDAQELVQPKLLESFLAYSTQSESYV